MNGSSTSAVVLLDGGLGQEINRRSRQDKSHPLWSVEVMMNEPDLVVQVHKDFLEAGARVLCPNNYTATPLRLRKFDLESRLNEIHQQAISLLDEAIAQADVDREDISKMGCLPPLAASYIASAAPSYHESYEQYSKLVDVQQPFVDGFLVETMSNLTEIRAVVDVLKSVSEPIYLSLTLMDDGSNRLRSGESLLSALDFLVGRNVAACLINCSIPESVSAALPLIAKSGLRFGAYANGFTSVMPLSIGSSVDVLERRTDLVPEAYCDYALEWIDGGAEIIGGCCEISPAHISFLKKSLSSRGINCTKLL